MRTNFSTTNWVNWQRKCVHVCGRCQTHLLTACEEPRLKSGVKIYGASSAHHCPFGTIRDTQVSRKSLILLSGLHTPALGQGRAWAAAEASTGKLHLSQLLLSMAVKNATDIHPSECFTADIWRVWCWWSCAYMLLCDDTVRTAWKMFCLFIATSWSSLATYRKQAETSTHKLNTCQEHSSVISRVRTK